MVAGFPSVEDSTLDGLIYYYRLLCPARRAIERDERAIARWVAEG